MSIIPKSWTGVDELRDQIWQLRQKVELLEMLYARVQQPRPTATPERALNAATVLAEAIVTHNDKSPSMEFYNAAGGYLWFKRNATAGNLKVVTIWMRDKQTDVPWCLSFGRRGAGRSKSRCFATRLEAEQFAFDVLTIHEAECIKRKAPTDWWNRVKIFEVIKR